MNLKNAAMNIGLGIGMFISYGLPTIGGIAVIYLIYRFFN